MSDEAEDSDDRAYSEDVYSVLTKDRQKSKKFRRKKSLTKMALINRGRTFARSRTRTYYKYSHSSAESSASRISLGSNIDECKQLEVSDFVIATNNTSTPVAQPVPIISNSPIPPRPKIVSVTNGDRIHQSLSVGIVSRDPTDAVTSPAEHEHPRVQLLTKPTEGDEQLEDTSVNPHRCARKFLCRLAPLLKLSLPSRVERKRTESVFDQQTSLSPYGKGGNPVAYAPRISSWAKQWVKHGVRIQHCLTFMDNNRSVTNSGPNTALVNADCYAQDLWEQLQELVHGQSFCMELRKRKLYANSVLQKIVSFNLLSDPSHSMKSEENVVSLGQKNGEFVTQAYLDEVVRAFKPVTELLNEADRVEQFWSSEARLISEFPDWALPEVRCRLVCLNQWSGKFISLFQSIGQLCDFLHRPANLTCPVHSTSSQSMLDNLAAKTTEIESVLFGCPVLPCNQNTNWRAISRAFLQRSWAMSPLLLTFPQSNSRTFSGIGGFSESPTEPSTNSSSGLSVALIRLDRFVDRLISEPSKKESPNKTSPANNSFLGNRATPKTRTPQKAPMLLTVPTIGFTETNQDSSDNYKSNDLLSVHSNVPPFIPRTGSQLQLPMSHEHGAELSPIGRDHARRLFGNLSSPNFERRSLKFHKTPSYADIVKRRTWCGFPLPLRGIRFYDSGAETCVDGISLSDHRPVGWEICSPAQSGSPCVRSASSSSSGTSYSTPASSRSSSTSSPAGSQHNSSSNSSVASVLRPCCAVEDSPTSNESSASFFSVDIDARLSNSPFLSSPREFDQAYTSDTAKSLQSWTQKDVGNELGLPTLVPFWIFIAKIPFNLTKEAVAMKLEQYSDRVNSLVQPDNSSLEHLISELRDLLSTSVQVTSNFRKRLLAGLKLNTTAHLHDSADRFWNKRKCTADEADSDSENLSVSHTVNDCAEFTLSSPVSECRQKFVWPNWFRLATREVSEFVNNSSPPGTLRSGQRITDVSLPNLLTAYVDCFIRLIDDNCVITKREPRNFRDRFESEWNFIRRIFRQLIRCRGGLQYVLGNQPNSSVSHPGLSAESAFIEACRRLINYISHRLGPSIGNWLHSSITLPGLRSSTNGLENWESRNGFEGESAEPEAVEADNCDEAEPGTVNHLDGWTSPKSSVTSITFSVTGVRSEIFHEFNESWRKLRAWLNCLLDLSSAICADLDNAVVLEFSVPLKPNSNKLRPSVGTRQPESTTDQKACTEGQPDKTPAKPISSDRQAYTKFTKELRRTGHVLLYSWDAESDAQFASCPNLKAKTGCIFISSSILKGLPVSSSSVRNSPAKTQSNEKKRGPTFQNGNRSRSSVIYQNEGVIVTSPSERRTIREHVCQLVHRLTQQALFRARKRFAPKSVVGMKCPCGFCTNDGLPISSANPEPRPESPELHHHRSQSWLAGETGECKTTSEYLLICPNIPQTAWTGLVYHPDNAKTNYGQRLWCCLNWLVRTSCFYSRPSELGSSDQSVPITCWMMADRPYSAWITMRDSSVRLRRWLSIGLTASQAVVGDEQSKDEPDKLDLNSSTLHFTPLQSELCVCVGSLRTSLCDLSARLHASLLVMESHLRSICDQVLDDLDWTKFSVGSAGDCSSEVNLSKTFSPKAATSVNRDYSIDLSVNDSLQRAYSIVFNFHKTLIRLMTAAPLNSIPAADDCGQPEDTGVSTAPIQTRLANLGVQLLASWARFVTVRYPRGRGRIPRWANDACHFAYQLCQPRSVTFLGARKVSSLEATLNYLIPHLVGEEKLASPPTASTAVSGGSPSTDRTHSLSAVPVQSASGEHLGLHSFYSSVLPRRKLSSVSRANSRKRKAQLRRSTGTFGSDDSPRSGSLQHNVVTPVSLQGIDFIRDEKLRRSGLIGRPCLGSSEQANGSALSDNNTTAAADIPDANGEPEQVNLDDVLSSKAVNLGRRHFPYAWNRGRLIGRGVTGEVYQAFNVNTNEMMAVKEIHLDHDPFSELRSSMMNASRQSGGHSHTEALGRLNAFRRECDLLSSLSHSALVRFLGADEQTPRVFRLFTELCTAGTLAQVVKDRPPEILVRRYARDLARAVAYLHERGIIHRDIKPANIFLVGAPITSRSTSPAATANRGSKSCSANPGASHATATQHNYSLLKLGDFSHALRLHSFSNSMRDGEIREVAGTICYMAPEVCQSQSKGLDTGYGRPCDIWSYCCVLLELLTGRQPWYGYRDSLAIFYQLCQNHIPTIPQPRLPNSTKCEPVKSQNPSPPPSSDTLTDSLPTASEEAVVLLRAGIQSDPSSRPTAAQLFQFDFVHCPVSPLGNVPELSDHHYHRKHIH
ncbi:unnamed protein product [Calicophoron daubneyi]|uniref:Protein kinase domain-containing protein n=1 Tax=Calicophoron daubneyi TaxID=300641 RepID=A0AAV2TFF3_CALDB